MSDPVVPQESTPGAEPAPPCVLVIFGALGDLTRRKLIPALYNLSTAGFLPPQFAVVGVARQEMTTEAFRAQVAEELPRFATSGVDAAVAGDLVGRLHYVRGDFKDPGLYSQLAQELERIEGEAGTGGSRIYYLAVPPSLFSPIVEQLGAADLVEEAAGRFRRVIVEKPFGHDLESAQALNRDLLGVLAESQIYRIDHYLGKETVQNIMVFRFANGIFEPIWNRRYVDHVQITVAETVGVEGRGGYYEEAGALRDMVQNHMFQLLALVGMEPPISFQPDAVRDERLKILRAIRPLTQEEVMSDAVRGQYGPGTVDDEAKPGYRHEPDVSPDSPVETYVALRLAIDNWRWADVPFYLRTGKRLPQRVTEIAIQFKRAPFMLFRDTPVEHLKPNLLVIRIQPDEGISLRFEGKVPGPVMRLGTVKMAFLYSDYFGTSLQTGYETLLYDAMTGDSTLFHRSDMVEAGWSIVTPILDVWKALVPRHFPNYPAGGWGPREADELLERDGRKWKNGPNV
jgi:glucose-6-phosphate 1-dehydrogenase